MEIKLPSEYLPSDPRFGVGPSLIPTKYLERLTELNQTVLGTSHRRPGVVSHLQSTHELLREYFELPSDYQIVIGNGGASFFFDVFGLNLVKNKSTHYIAGEFADKWARSHELIPGVETKRLETEYGQSHHVTIGDPGDGSDAICATLNETSTGVVLHSLPGKNEVKNSSAILGIDATSGAGQIPIDMQAVDCYFFSLQKVFASDGGTFVAFFSPKALERVEKLNGSRYVPAIMNLKSHIDINRKFENLNTPAIIPILILEMQLADMVKMGRNKVDELTQKRADLFYNWAQASPFLSPFVQEKAIRSPVVGAIKLNDSIDAQKLASVLREQSVALDIEGYRKIPGNNLRVSLFHNISLENLEKLTKAIDYVAQRI